MNIRTKICCWLLIATFTLLFSVLAFSAPTTQQAAWMQAIVDSPGAKTLGLSKIVGTFPDGDAPAVPTPPKPSTGPKLFPQIRDGDVIDLQGKTYTLKAPIYPVGKSIVRNGTIIYDGNGGKVNADGMCCFVVREGVDFTADHVHFQIPKKVGASKLVGGSIVLTECTQTNGTLLAGQGGEFAGVYNCTSTGVPDKYWIINSTNLLKILRVDNSGAPGWLQQGKNEALIRLMQVDDSYIKGVNSHGSGVKQDGQDRPAGKPGSKYKQHIWENCTFTSVDCGNFKDHTDVNFPFGRLGLSQWINCTIGHFSRTDQGDNALSKKDMGVDVIQFINTKVAGKVTNSTVSK